VGIRHAEQLQFSFCEELEPVENPRAFITAADVGPDNRICPSTKMTGLLTTH
jgi:hypothetical protein